MQRHLWSTILVSVSLAAGVGAAHAQPYAPSSTTTFEEPRPTRIFIEAFGNWGVNLGRTEYIPDGEPGTSKHPFANGFGAGATVGAMVLPDWLGIIGDYRYGRTSTREGDITNVLTSVEGSLHFHAITAGVRLQHRSGRLRTYGQLHVGVLLPFETKLEFEYAPPLGAVGIQGVGTRTEKFNVAYGAQAELGIRFDVAPRFFIGAGVRIATFQASNAGKETEYDNFVVDFAALPPVPVTTSIHHGTNGPIPPTTYSVQDVRLNIAIGTGF